MVERGRRRLGWLGRTVRDGLNPVIPVTVPVRRPAGRRVLAALGPLLLVATLCAPPARAAGLSQEYWLPLFQMDKVWQITHGEGVTVAVLDTGVPVNGDLAGRVLPGADFVQPGGDGTTDPGRSDQANYSHGAHMAMLIAGTGARTGFTGLAPAAKILPVRVVADERQTGANTGPALTAGIRYAVDHRAKIINMSLGDSQDCPADLQAAVRYAYQHGVIVVAASGNDGQSKVDTPSNCYGALSVGDVDQSFVRWSKSNYGAGLDFVAPGVDHPIPLPSGRIIPSSEHNSGTSESAALVSGVLALLWSHYPHDSARQVVTRTLWHLHNGLGGKIYGRRINDELGYGQPLPYFALSQSTPSSAANPIYDEADRYFGGSVSATASSHSTPASSSHPAAATAAAGAKSGSKSGTARLLAGALVVLLLAGAGFGATRRVRARGR